MSGPSYEDAETPQVEEWVAEAKAAALTEAERAVWEALNAHTPDGFFSTQDGHRECYCGHVLAEGETWLTHVAARVARATADDRARLAAGKASVLWEAADDLRGGRIGVGIDEIAETLEARAASYQADARDAAPEHRPSDALSVESRETRQPSAPESGDQR